MKFFFLVIVEYIRLLHETKKYNALFPIKLCTTVLQLSDVTEMGEAEMGRSQMTVKGKSKVKFISTSVGPSFPLRASFSPIICSSNLHENPAAVAPLFM